jgi:AbrB family looped-hinge helix DNA binding protein
MVKVMQLKNKQFIITIPKMMAELLNVKKGDKISYVRNVHGGIEIRKE